MRKTDLDDGGKVLSVDVVLRLEVQITQLAGSHRVVLGIELVEALEGLSALLKKQHKTPDKNFRRGRVGRGECCFFFFFSPKVVGIQAEHRTWALKMNDSQ